MNLRSVFELIPNGAKILAAFSFSLLAVVMSRFMDGTLGSVGGAVLGACVAAYILLSGYVYGDAARRGMPPVPWTALAVMVPNCIGFVLYFLLRKPIVHPCANCGFGVSPDACFCPKCGHRQSSADGGGAA